MNYSSLFLIAVSILLAGSLVLHLFIGVKFRNVYLHRQMIALDPFNSINFPVHFNKGYDDNDLMLRVLFYGDSRAEQWKAPDEHPDFQFQNRGIGGQSTFQILGRISKHVIPLKPHIVILQLGVNDLKTIPFVPELYSVIIENCKNNIARLIQECTENNIIVILSTIFPIGTSRFLIDALWITGIHKAVAEVNNYLMSLNGKNVYLFDTFSILANKQGTVKREYRKGFIHLNTKAYSILNKSLYEILLKIKEQNKM